MSDKFARKAIIIIVGVLMRQYWTNKLNLGDKEYCIFKHLLDTDFSILDTEDEYNDQP